MKKRKSGRVAYFEEGGASGGEGGNGSDGSDGGFGSESAGMSAADAAGLASFGADVSGFSNDAGPSFGGGYGGSGDYGPSGPANPSYPYSLNNYVPQSAEQQFYQPIYRPQYTDYRTGIASLPPQQPSSGISSLLPPESAQPYMMPQRMTGFESYGLPFSGYNFTPQNTGISSMFSGYNWPTYMNPGV